MDERRKVAVVWGLALAVTLASCLTVWAQQGGNRRRAAQRGGASENSEDEVQLPADPRLLALHREFVRKAEKLAADYERADDDPRARAVYQEILKLVPNYGPAEERLEKIRQREATAERAVVDVHANRPWQDTGVMLIEGKPVTIEARGTWTFRMSHEITPDGIEIPEELRDFNIGALVGVIDGAVSEDEDPPQPFLVGTKLEMVAPMSGRLLLRMYDGEPSDNVGKLTVDIQGTFEKR